MEKLIHKTTQVKTLLQKSKHLRDDDMKLIAKVWAMESGLSENNPVFKKMIDGKLTAPDYITRARRRIQENVPSLRGKSYKARQIKGRTIKKEIVK
jgi:hypothetical protein